mgnify:CR=1 FL=1
MHGLASKQKVNKGDAERDAVYRAALEQGEVCVPRRERRMTTALDTSAAHAREWVKRFDQGVRVEIKKNKALARPATPPPPPSPVPSTPEYERERTANIERNKEALRALGL